MTAKRTATLLLLSVSLLLLTALATVAFAQPIGEVLNLSLQTFVPPGELEAPVEIAHAGDERLFIVEREGRVRIVRRDGAVDATLITVVDPHTFLPAIFTGLP